MAKPVTLDGISFYPDSVSRYKSMKDWLEYCKVNPHWFENDKNRTKKLKQVYNIITGNADNSETAEEVPGAEHGQDH